MSGPGLEQMDGVNHAFDKTRDQRTVGGDEAAGGGDAADDRQAGERVPAVFGLPAKAQIDRQIAGGDLAFCQSRVDRLERAERQHLGVDAGLLQQNF